MEQWILNHCTIHGKYFIYTKNIFHDDNKDFMGFSWFLKAVVYKKDTDWFPKLTEIHDALESKPT